MKAWQVRVFFQNTLKQKKGEVALVCGYGKFSDVTSGMKKCKTKQTGGWRKGKKNCTVITPIFSKTDISDGWCVSAFSCDTSQMAELRSYFSQHFCVRVIFNRSLLFSSYSQTRTRSVIHRPPVRSCGSHVTLANAQKELKMRKKKRGKGEQNCSSHREL